MMCTKCRPDCKHYIHDCREYAGDPQPRQVEGCVFRFIYDELKNMNTRQAMMQAELGETKQAALFQAIGSLSQSPEAKEELRKLIMRTFQGAKQLA